jgi:Aminotransferase class I and II
MSFFMSATLLESCRLCGTSPARLEDMIDGLTASRFCVLHSRLLVEKLGRALLKHGPEHEFIARYLMCSSDLESMSIRDLLALEPRLMEGLGSRRLGYTEYPCAPDLRRKLATLYELIDIDNLIVHTGAQDAIFSFVHSMLKAGDHMIVHMPGYRSHYLIAEASGASVWSWRARESENWALDRDELEKLDRFCTEVLERTGVLLLLPGTLLDHDDEHFRIGLRRRDLPDILKIFENYLRECGTK